MAEYAIKPINEVDEEAISRFVCSVPTENNFVEDFLKEKALDFHEYNIARTQVIMDKSEVVGYFTLFTDYFGLGQKRLQDNGWDESEITTHGKFPSVRIHSLGVRDGYKCQKLGKGLLDLALDTCIEIADKAGCTFVNVESFNHSEVFYKKSNFRRIHSKNDDLKIMAIRIRDLEGA